MRYHLFTLFLFLVNIGFASTKLFLPLEKFSSLAKKERQDYILQLNLEKKDSVFYQRYYNDYLAACKSQSDENTQAVLLFKKFEDRSWLQLPQKEIDKLLEKGRTISQKHDLKIEQIVFEHYYQFEQYTNHGGSIAKLYEYLLYEMTEMESLGFEKFIPFQIDKLLHHTGRIFYELEDFDKALATLTKAQSMIKLRDGNIRVYIAVTNIIQTIHQKNKNAKEGILEAKKILNVVSKYIGENQKFNEAWKGLASIDIASMLVLDKKYVEAEQYADEGYIIFKKLSTQENPDLEAEFNALMVLIKVKYDLNKIGEARPLIDRAGVLYKDIIKFKKNYFKQIPYYEILMKDAELRGNYEKAVFYTNLLAPIKDSLTKRNDAHTLSKISQRIEAQRYRDKLTIIEGEKTLQKWIIAGVLIILSLLFIIARVSYLKSKANQKLLHAELEAAKVEMQTFAKAFKEKSELSEALRIEIERLSTTGDHNDNHEQLLNSTILTNEDWLEFRSVFEKVHPNFINVQKDQYPDLTQAELRYLVLDKLQLSTKEMANMLGVTDGAIRQIKSRLRGKMQ